MIKTFYPDAYVRTTTRYYRAWFVLPGDTSAEVLISERMERWQLARAMRTARGAGMPSIRWEHYDVTQWAEACPWCGARPEQMDRDCDGVYGTGTCGSEQCAQLKRCDGCKRDGVAAITSWRGDLCHECDNTAHRAGMRAHKFMGLPGYGLAFASSV